MLPRLLDAGRSGQVASHRHRRRSHPVLVYLAASHDELWARVSKRNEFHADDPNSIYFSESDLQRYRNRFIPPQADEPHLLYAGDAADVIAAMEASQP